MESQRTAKRAVVHIDVLGDERRDQVAIFGRVLPRQHDVTRPNCRKARSASTYDRCKGVYEGLAAR